MTSQKSWAPVTGVRSDLLQDAIRRLVPCSDRRKLLSCHGLQTSDFSAWSCLGHMHVLMTTM